MGLPPFGSVCGKGVEGEEGEGEGAEGSRCFSIPCPFYIVHRFWNILHIIEYCGVSELFRCEDFCDLRLSWAFSPFLCASILCASRSLLVSFALFAFAFCFLLVFARVFRALQ